MTYKIDIVREEQDSLRREEESRKVGLVSRVRFWWALRMEKELWSRVYKAEIKSWKSIRDDLLRKSPPSIFNNPMSVYAPTEAEITLSQFRIERREHHREIQKRIDELKKMAQTLRFTRGRQGR